MGGMSLDECLVYLSADTYIFFSLLLSFPMCTYLCVRLAPVSMCLSKYTPFPWLLLVVVTTTTLPSTHTLVTTDPFGKASSRNGTGKPFMVPVVHFFVVLLLFSLTRRCLFF